MVPISAVFLALALFLLPSCRHQQARRPADTIVIGVLADIQSWNPYLTETKFSEDLLALVYPSLMVEDVDYRQHPPSFRPALAKSWEFSEDHLDLVLHLDPEARWSDGAPMGAADLLFTWKVQHDPAIGWYGAYTKDFINSMEIIDPHTLRVSFDHVYPYQLMDLNEGLILPAHAWEKIPFGKWSSVSWLDKVVAGGPFRPESHLPQQEIRLARNGNDAPGDRTKISHVIWRIIPDQFALVSQLKAGELDFLNTVPPEDAAFIAADPRYRLVDYPDRGYTHVCWNTRKELFSDRRVRRALGEAINRDQIIATVYHGYAQPAIGPILSTMWAFDHSLKPIPFSPKEARRDLASCGWKDSDGDGFLDRDGRIFEFELLTNAENRMRQDIALLIAEDLKAVGVRVIPRSLEWGSFLRSLQDGRFDAAINRWVEPTQIDLEDLWHTPPEGAPSSNYGGYSNPAVDQLIEQVSAEADFVRQAPLYFRIQRLIVEDQPYVFLAESRRLNAIHRRIKGAVLNDATPYFNLEQWSIDPEAD